MKNILTFFTITTIVYLSSLFIGLPAYANSSTTFGVDVLNPVCSNLTGGASNSPVCKDNAPNGQNPITSTIGNVLKIVSYAIGFIAVLSLIVAGLRMVLSGGDPETVKSVRNTILYAVIGIVIAASAQLIVVFVLEKL